MLPLVRVAWLSAVFSSIPILWSSPHFVNLLIAFPKNVVSPHCIGETTDRDSQPLNLSVDAARPLQKR